MGFEVYIVVRPTSCWTALLDEDLNPAPNQEARRKRPTGNLTSPLLKSR